MVQKFHDELNQLTTEIITMGQLAKEMLQKATDSLKNDDIKLSSWVQSKKRTIAEMDRTIEVKALRLIALYQPMAKDMRTIACCLKMNTYLMRIGRYAKDIAKVTNELHDVPRMKKIVHINKPLFKGKVLGMIFQKPSLRTRVSFDMAMRHMGGDALYLSPSEIGLGQRESIADVARVLSGYVHALMARVFAHAHIVELARWSSVPVLNGLSDYNHPCQAMADALTIQEKFGRAKGLKVVFVGDGNNVAVSLMHVSVKLGWNFTIANPEGYDLNAEAVAIARNSAKETGSQLAFLRDPREAVKGAQVIYTDTWTSMGQEEETARREAVPRWQAAHRREHCRSRAAGDERLQAH